MKKKIEELRPIKFQPIDFASWEATLPWVKEYKEYNDFKRKRGLTEKDVFDFLDKKAKDAHGVGTHFNFWTDPKFPERKPKNEEGKPLDDKAIKELIELKFIQAVDNLASGICQQPIDAYNFLVQGLSDKTHVPQEQDADLFTDELKADYLRAVSLQIALASNLNYTSSPLNDRVQKATLEQAKKGFEQAKKAAATRYQEQAKKEQQALEKERKLAKQGLQERLFGVNALIADLRQTTIPREINTLNKLKLQLEEKVEALELDLNDLNQKIKANSQGMLSKMVGMMTLQFLSPPPPPPPAVKKATDVKLLPKRLDFGEGGENQAKVNPAEVSVGITEEKLKEHAGKIVESEKIVAQLRKENDGVLQGQRKLRDLIYALEDVEIETKKKREEFEAKKLAAESKSQGISPPPPPPPPPPMNLQQPKLKLEEQKKQEKAKEESKEGSKVEADEFKKEEEVKIENKAESKVEVEEPKKAEEVKIENKAESKVEVEEPKKAEEAKTENKEEPEVAQEAQVSRPKGVTKHAKCLVDTNNEFLIKKLEKRFENTKDYEVDDAKVAEAKREQDELRAKKEAEVNAEKIALVKKYLASAEGLLLDSDALKKADGIRALVRNALNKIKTLVNEVDKLQKKAKTVLGSDIVVPIEEARDKEVKEDLKGEVREEAKEDLQDKPAHWSEVLNLLKGSAVLHSRLSQNLSTGTLTALDVILWVGLSQVIQRRQNLTPAVINDLALLQEFIAEKIKAEETQKYGDELMEFYRQAVAIRLSDSMPAEQHASLVKAAKEIFKADSGALRLLADLLGVLSDFTIGLARRAFGYSFFSNKEENPGKQVLRELIKTELAVEEEPEEGTALFQAYK